MCAAQRIPSRATPASHAASSLALTSVVIHVQIQAPTARHNRALLAVLQADVMIQPRRDVCHVYEVVLRDDACKVRLRGGPHATAGLTAQKMSKAQHPSNVLVVKLHLS